MFLDRLPFECRHRHDHCQRLDVRSPDVGEIRRQSKHRHGSQQVSVYATYQTLRLLNALSFGGKDHCCDMGGRHPSCACGGRQHCCVVYHGQPQRRLRLLQRPHAKIVHLRSALHSQFVGNLRFDLTFSRSDTEILAAASGFVALYKKQTLFKYRAASGRRRIAGSRFKYDLLPLIWTQDPLIGTPFTGYQANDDYHQLCIRGCKDQVGYAGNRVGDFVRQSYRSREGRRLRG